MAFGIISVFKCMLGLQGNVIWVKCRCLFFCLFCFSHVLKFVFWSVVWFDISAFIAAFQVYGAKN